MCVRIIVHNCHTQHSTEVPIICPLILQTITIAQITSTGVGGITWSDAGDIAND